METTDTNQSTAAPRSRPTRAGWAALVSAGLLYSVLGLVLTYPVWLHAARAVPSDIGDPLLNTWILAWDTHALLSDPLHLFDANLFYPLANTLAYSEHLLSTALLILPIQLVTGEPVLAYNLSLLLSFPLAGLGMYLLLFHWTRRRGAAFLAGLAYAFAPYRLASISHLQLLAVQWIPFCLLALDRLLTRQAPDRGVGGTAGVRRAWVRDAALLTLFLTAQILASWYLAVFCLLILGLYVLGWLLAKLWRRRPGRVLIRPLARLAIPLLAVSALALPFALPYLDVLPQLQAARPTTWATALAAKPADYLAAASFLRLPGPLTQKLSMRPGFTEENHLWLGIVTPVLALVGLVLGRPRWRTGALAAILILSLALTFAGPYLALTRILPILTLVRVPPRWVIPATFALAGLAGYGAAQPRSHTARRALVAVAGLVLVAESFSVPLPLARVGSSDDLPQVYYALASAARTDPGAVVELPIYVAPAAEYPETKRLYASTLGWWGLVNGYSGFTPPRQAELGAELATFPGEQALATLRSLSKTGVLYLVVHPDEAPLDRKRWEQTDRWEAERQTSLLPLGRFGPDELYRINPYGDRLITEPSAITDAYWTAHRPVPADVRFALPASGGEIRLLTYQYEPGDPASQPLLPAWLSLYWQASAPVGASYTVFVHAVAANGTVVGQADGLPVGAHYPTTAWQPGEIVQDRRVVPGATRYRVGLYDLATGQRLPAFAADGSRLPYDAVEIVTSGSG